jgi:Transposase
MPYRPLLTGESHTETCPQLGYMGYIRIRLREATEVNLRQEDSRFRAHEALLLNWFRAKGEISAGAVEGLNNKIRVVTRRSYGFRTYNAMEMALYHALGRLPEPESAHKFC